MLFWQFFEFALVGLLLFGVLAFLPFSFGWSGWHIPVSLAMAAAKTILVAVLAALMVFVIGMSTSTWVVILDREVGPKRPGIQLPELKVIGEFVPGRRTKVCFGGVQPSTSMAFLRRLDGTVDPDSALGGQAGKSNLVMFETPADGLDETTAFPDLVHELRVLHHNQDFELVPIGLSYGSTIVRRFVSWYGPMSGGVLGHLGAEIYIFPIDGRRSVRWNSRILMYVTSPYVDGPFFNIIRRSNRIADLLTPEEPGGRARAHADGGDVWYAKMREDNRRFRGNYLANVGALFRSHVFGGPAEYPGHPVYVLALPDGQDAFLLSGQAVAAVQATYPDAHVIWIRQGGHGQTAEFGPYFRSLIDGIIRQLDGARRQA